MNATINKHQLNQIISYIIREYEVFGVQKKNNKIVFDKLNNANNLLTWVEKPVMPFKKILWPNDQEINTRKFDKKLAFLGLTNCDAEALDIFLKEFSQTDLLPKRSDILVVTSECKPNDNCFCTAFGTPQFKFSDLHIQEEGKNFEIFAFSKTAKKILDENGVEKFNPKLKIREIKNENAERLDLKKIATAIDDKTGHLEYWQKIAGACFGCGACTAVCPLCFCFRLEPDGLTDQPFNRSTCWNSCYSKSFFQISSHNFRPENSDRMYNWYHHKFCRSMSKNNYPLCTGCGRCIDACPAHLNQHHIIKGIEHDVTDLSSRAK